MGYLLSPDDTRLLPASDRDPTDTWVPDPLNAKRAPGAFGIDWSVVNLTGEPLAPWLTDARPAVSEGRLVDLDVESAELGVRVPVRVLLPPGFEVDREETYPLLLFFDGYGYFEIDQAHRLIEQLVERGDIAPTVAVFIYNPDATRNRDMSCHQPTHRFLEHELVPLLRDRFRSGRTPGETVLAGRSRSGLGAVCAAFRMPHVIGRAISQSGSFWWAPEGQELEWLARQMATRPRKPIELYLDAGLLEEGPNPDLGLSMLTVTRTCAMSLARVATRCTTESSRGGTTRSAGGPRFRRR